NKAPFYVTGAGEMHSVSGYIGGWEIKTSSIRYAVKGTSENTLLGAGTNYPISVGATWETDATNPNWGGAVFRVAKDGTLTASNANIMGKLRSIASSTYVVVDEGHIYGGTVSSTGTLQTASGYISFNQVYNTTGGYGTRIGGKSMIALVSPVIGVGAYRNYNQDATIYVGQTKNLTYVSKITRPDINVDCSYVNVYDQYSHSDVQVVNGVSVSVTINHEYTTISFTKGLMTSE
ncbi:hypothetical protein ACR77U_13365, partial [Enterococcus faecium]|uniref:hypothetical protein n=1 Tax=Enterococcus faecium TaxID=1352 RepID=UPI003DA268D7